MTKICRLAFFVFYYEVLPLGAVWCKTRLFNSDGQFDRHCNLIGGAILAQVICAYDYHRPKVQWGVRECVCERMCVGERKRENRYVRKRS